MEQEIQKKQTYREKYISHGEELVSFAQGIIVKSDEDYQKAVEFVGKVKEQKKLFTDFIKPMKEAAHRTHKTITANETAVVAVFDKAETAAKKQMIAYVEKKEKDAAAERKIKEEALKALEEKKVELPPEVQDLFPEGLSAAIIPIKEEPKKIVRVESGASAISGKDFDIEIDPSGGFSKILQQVLSGSLPATIVSVDLVALKKYMKAAAVESVQGVLKTEKTTLKISAGRK